MATTRILPYEHSNALQLVVAECLVDDVPRAVVNEGTSRVELSEVDHWVRAVLRMTVSAEALGDVVPPAERDDPPVACHVIVACSETRVRRACKLERSGPTTWRGSVAVERRDVRGAVSLRPAAVRVSDAEGSRKYARRRGVEIATGTEWTVSVDEQAPPGGSLLKWRWERFSQSEHLRRYARATHYLDLSSEPLLWLNDDVPHLRELLLSTKKQGREAALRDALIDAIVRSAWPAIITAAAMTASEDEEGTWVPEGEWQRAALAQFAPRITAEKNVDVAISALVVRLKSEETAPTFVGELEAFIQDHFRMKEGLQKLIAATGGGD